MSNQLFRVMNCNPAPQNSTEQCFKRCHRSVETAVAQIAACRKLCVEEDLGPRLTKTKTKANEEQNEAHDASVERNVGARPAQEQNEAHRSNCSQASKFLFFF